MSKTKKAECPICKGTGQFELPAKMEVDSAEIKKQLAIELHKKGYSIRQIQKALGYKSPRSIQIILNKQQYDTGTYTGRHETNS